MTKKKRTVYVCRNCNSDNVQTRAWVSPNNNNEFVDEIDDDEMGWCEDCHSDAIIEVREFDEHPYVHLGYQVCVKDNTGQEPEMHPDMENRFCVYNLEQARKMLRDNDRGFEFWKLQFIRLGDIKEPISMFEGDPRN